VVFEVVFRGLWDALTDPGLKMEWEEAVLPVGSFLLFFVIQRLTLGCRRRWVRYLPMILMTVLWILTEYLVASEPSMGAAVLVMIAGYPVVLGWTGTVVSCLVRHLRKLFVKLHKTSGYFL